VRDLCINELCLDGTDSIRNVVKELDVDLVRANEMGFHGGRHVVNVFLEVRCDILDELLIRSCHGYEIQ